MVIKKFWIILILMACMMTMLAGSVSPVLDSPDELPKAKSGDIYDLL